jgi:hypothetical protein
MTDEQPATTEDIEARLTAHQDPGVTGVARVMLGDTRVGILIYVEDHKGWDVLEVTPQGRYRSLTMRPTIDGFVDDWQACARSAFPELAERLAGRT